MNLNEDFREFIQLLNKHNAEYLVVGGYAVAAYGFPRYTGDIDFWIKPTQENAQRIVTALHDFGFGSVDIDVADLTTAGRVIQLGFPPNRIDILTSISGVTFEECWDQRTMVDFEATTIPFISLHHLKQNKQASGRTKDKLDLENLP